MKRTGTENTSTAFQSEKSSGIKMLHGAALLTTCGGTPKGAIANVAASAGTYMMAKWRNMLEAIATSRYLLVDGRTTTIDWFSLRALRALNISTTTRIDNAMARAVSGFSRMAHLSVVVHSLKFMSSYHVKPCARNHQRNPPTVARPT